MNTNQEVSKEVQELLDRLQQANICDFVDKFKQLDDFVNTKTVGGRLKNHEDGAVLERLEQEFYMAFDAFFQVINKHNP